MRRRFFTITSVLSLLLCLASLTLWARSYWVTNTLMRQRTFRNLLLVHDTTAFSLHGALCLWDLRRYDDGSGSRTRDWTREEFGTTWRLSSEEADTTYPNINASSLPRHTNDTARSREFHVLGFAFVGRIQHHEEIWRRDVVVIVPWAAVVLLTALLPAMGLLQWRKSRLAAKNAAMLPCRECGYSLLKNTSGTCPECGMPVLHVAEVTA